MDNLTRTLAAVFLLALCACANNHGEVSAPQADLPPASAATLRVGQLDTGFLFLGNTRIQVISVDGKGAAGDSNRPLLLAPGPHTMLITAFRDPVFAYACVTSTFEAGKTYVAQSTKPYMETTTMWIEDSASGEAVGEKIAAQMMRQPVAFSPALNQLLFGSTPHKCE